MRKKVVLISSADFAGHLTRSQNIYDVKIPEDEIFFKHFDLGENPPQSAILYYHLDEEPEQPVEITILNANGGEIEHFSSKKAENAATSLPKEDTEDEDDKSVMGIHKPVVTAKPGPNRFVWNLRYPRPKVKLDKSLEKPGDVSVGNQFAKPLGRIGEDGEGGAPIAAP